MMVIINVYDDFVFFFIILYVLYVGPKVSNILKLFEFFYGNSQANFFAFYEY